MHKQQGFVAIPRLEEYYRPKAPKVGWGEDVPAEFMQAKPQSKCESRPPR